MARPNLIICSVTRSAQSNYRDYATPKTRRSSHSDFLTNCSFWLILCLQTELMK